MKVKSSCTLLALAVVADNAGRRQRPKPPDDVANQLNFGYIYRDNPFFISDKTRA